MKLKVNSNEREELTLSKIDARQFRDGFIRRLGIAREPVKFVTPEGSSTEDISFEWIPNVSESNSTQIKKVLDYFLTNLKDFLPNNVIIHNVANLSEFLNIDSPMLPYRIKGSTDIILVEEDFVDNLCAQSGIRAIIELKKDKLTELHVRQTIMKMVAADLHANNEYKVFGVLTNLKEWHVYWMEMDGEKKIKSTHTKNSLKAMNFIGLMAQSSDVRFDGIEQRIHRIKFRDFFKDNNAFGFMDTDIDIANMEDFYDEMEEDERRRYELRKAFTLLKTMPLFQTT